MENPFLVNPPQFAPNVLVRCDLFDSQTGQVVKSYAPEKKVAARRKAEKMCMEHGSYRYSVRLVWG